MILVLVVTGWAGSARVLRSQALSIRSKDFVAAAVVSGERAGRIMFREILPNMASIVMGTLLACVIYGIGAQAGLEFLGLGDVSTVSWGNNLFWAGNEGALLTGSWWVFVPSGVCIALVAFALALINYAVDEVTNPRLRKIKTPKTRQHRKERRQMTISQVSFGSHEPVLDVKNLTVKYIGDTRSTTAVDRVSFSIGTGEVFGLAGESGCGKSTIANSIMRLLKDPAKIAGGSISFGGKDVLAMSPEELRRFRWQDVAMVFQSAMNSLNPVLTIGEQIVDIFTTHAGYSRKESLRRAGELLELVRIDPARLKSYPHQLSGGMRQRAVIAMAVALKPSLLILDEPTTALDVVVQQEIMAQIKELQRELGFSVLFITHDMSLMVELSHRMAVMYGGRIVETAKAQDVYSTPRHPYTQALMGAFPPLTGPRVPLTGLPDGVKFRNIPDLTEAAPGHFVAPFGADAPVVDSANLEGAAR